MLKKFGFGLAGLLVLAILASGGCSTTQSSTSLEAALDDVATIGSSEVTLSGSISYSDGTVDINLNSVLVSGEPVTLTSGRIRVRVGDSLTTVSSEDLVSFTLPTVSDRPMDIAFILDNTGSMSGAITGAKNSIVAFAASLEAAGADAQFGLVTYGDSAIHPTPVGYITAEGFTDASLASRPVMDFGTAAELRDILSTEVQADGGGDGPENPLDAVLYAYDNFTWRSGAQKILIIITDINAHQNVAGDTSSNNACRVSGEAVVSSLEGKAVIYAVSPNYTTSQDPYFDVRRLADGLGEGRSTALSNTGGKWIQFNSGSFDLNTLGIDTVVTALTTIRFSYSFSAGTYYIYVQVDTDGDGDFDSNMVITVVLSAASSIINGQPVGPGVARITDVKVLKADDGIPRPNN